MPMFMPFPFPMMPMQCMNGQQASGGQLPDGLPFPFMNGSMQQFPMPFPMAGMNNAAAESSGQQDGFSFMGLTIPTSMLQKLLNMDWPPEELDKLQKVIDMMYAMMPKKQ